MRLTVIATADGEILAFLDATRPAAHFADLRAQVAATGLRWHTLTLPPRLAAYAHAGHLRTLLAGHRVRLTHGVPYLALVAPDPPRAGVIVPATPATRTTTYRATGRAYGATGAYAA